MYLTIFINRFFIFISFLFSLHRIIFSLLCTTECQNNGIHPLFDDFRDMMRSNENMGMTIPESNIKFLQIKNLLKFSKISHWCYNNLCSILSKILSNFMSFCKIFWNVIFRVWTNFITNTINFIWNLWKRFMKFRKIW